MSAIAGRVEFGGGEPAGAAEKLRAALGFVVAEREAVWRDKACALVCKRLIVETRDRTAPLLQPTAAGIVVAIEGHLFNRPELAESLGLSPVSEDEELIAAAWGKWGDLFPAHLNGEFALAAWDPRKQRLLLAVDHVASVPLYHARNQSGQVVWATEISAIVAGASLRPEPDWNKIADYLANALFDEDRTFFAGIFAVPAGSVAVFSSGGAKVFRYWDYARIASPRIAGVEEGIARFRTSLERAVARRVPSTGPVAAHFTGGLDSSAVAGLAAVALKPHGDRLNLFSIVPTLPGDGPSGPGDVEYIRAFLRDFPECRHTYAVGFVAGGYPLPGIPNGPTNLQLTGAIETIAQLATRAGCRTMLNGYGGEVGPTYMGHGVHYAALRLGQWRWLLAEMGSRTTTWRERIRWCRRLVAEMGSRSERDCRLRWKVMQEQLRPEFIAQYRLKERVCDRRRAGSDPVMRGQWEQLRGIQIQGRLKDWAHHGRCRGFRYRYPLLDRELLEFVRSLPPLVHVRSGRRRELIRRALEPVLPAEILARESKYAPMVSQEVRAAGENDLRRKREDKAGFLIRQIVRQPPVLRSSEQGARNESNERLLGRLFWNNVIALGEFLADLTEHHDFRP